MKIHDINPKNDRIILLLHPMLATAKIMEILIAEPLGDGYRYIIPDFSDHGEASGEPYKSAVQEAAVLDSYLIDNQITKIELGFAASLGGVILMELLQRTNTSFGQLFFEGTSFSENAGWKDGLIKHIVISKHRKAKAHPKIAVEKMRQIYGNKVNNIMAEQMIQIQENSLVNIIRDCANVRLPKLSIEQQKRCVFAYGEKDGDLKTARVKQPRKYPYAKLIVWRNCGHCTKITEDNLEYAKILKSYLQ